jgi:hypothetical protein
MTAQDEPTANPSEQPDDENEFGWAGPGAPPDDDDDEVEGKGPGISKDTGARYDDGDSRVFRG